MENIFSPEPQFRQSQYQKLSDNVNEWEEEIHSNLSSIIPSKLGIKVMLHWQKVDDNQGYAVGSAILSDSSDKSVGIPIIVKQWHLAPLDTMMMEDKAYPLTPDTLKEVFSDSSLSTETIARTGPTQIFDSGVSFENTYPPLGGGKYSYGSLLKNVLDTIWEEDLEEFRKTARSKEIITAAAQRNPLTYEVMSKLAAKKGKEPKKKTRSKGIMHVSKKGVNQYQVMGTSKGVFDPVEHGFIDRPTLKKFINKVTGGGEAEEEAITRIDKNQEYTITQSTGPSEVFLYKTDSELTDAKQSCDKPGVYSIKDKAGVAHVGYILPNVINLDGSKAAIKIFLGNGISAIQSNFFGTPAPSRNMGLTESEPQHGDLGTLVYENNGKLLATTPFRIKSVGWNPQYKYITGVDYKGDNIDISFTANAQGITKIKDRFESRYPGQDKVKRYNAPMGLKFIPLGESKQFADTAKDNENINKLAFSSNPLKIIRHNSHYIFKAAGLEKYADVNNIHFDFSNLNRTQAQFLLASFGCPMNKIAEVLTPDAKHPEIQVHGLEWPKLASEIPEDTRLFDYIRSLRVNLVKEAAVLDEGEAVDVALSLGFINPENVDKFIEAIPKLKECLSLLSKLLIASRLGMSNIPEEATQSAIQNVLNVVSGLRKLGLMRRDKAS